jgi:uncharacterized protein YqfA (UPF0365 family)
MLPLSVTTPTIGHPATAAEVGATKTMIALRGIGMRTCWDAGEMPVMLMVRDGLLSTGGEAHTMKKVLSDGVLVIETATATASATKTTTKQSTTNRDGMD